MKGFVVKCFYTKLKGFIFILKGENDYFMATEKDWTIMIYMAGDNNLSADMAYALGDIREVMQKRGDKLNLMVYYDGAAIDAPTLYCDFTDFENPVYCPTNSVEKKFIHKKRRRRESDFDENSGAVYTLMNFVNWCVNDTNVSIYKKGETLTQVHSGKRAKKYALIFSGHASAFQNMSLMVDASSDYYMTIPKLRFALENIAKKEAPFFHNVPLLQQQIDLLGFDSCVMGMAELAYEFSRAAKTLVASEGNLPSAGWSYGNILSKLISPEPSEAVTDEKIVAQGFVEEFIKKQTDFLIGGISVDISALDLSKEKISSVIKNLDALGKSFIDVLHRENGETAQNLRHALLLAHLECQSYMFEQNVDLKDFCEILLEKIGNFSDRPGEVIRVCKNLIQAIDDCVLICGFSGGTYQFSNGLAVFFPWTARSYQTSQKNYEGLRVLSGKNPLLKNWNQFLQILTYQTLRDQRKMELSEDLKGKSAGFESFFPSKNNGIANDPNIFLGKFAGTNPDGGKNTHIDNDKNTHIGNDKNTHIGNDKNTHIGNDKNTHIGNDKNTHIGNDKNTHIGNDKGLQQYLMTQFKNVITSWNISGFTKSPASGKSEETPEVQPNAIDLNE